MNKLNNNDELEMDAVGIHGRDVGRSCSSSSNISNIGSRRRNGGKRPRLQSDDPILVVAAAASDASSTSSDEDDGHKNKKAKKVDHHSSKRSSDNDGKMNDLEFFDKDNDPTPFIQKLYAMINQCHDEFPDIACWSLDGSTFVVKDKDRFAKTITPLYFNQKNFSSLVRQLNFYGFSKMQSKEILNSDVNKKTKHFVSFCNKNFRQNRKDLLRHIRRSTHDQARGEQKKEIEGMKGKIAQLESDNQVLAKKLETIEQTLHRMFLQHQHDIYLMMDGQYPISAQAADTYASMTK